MEESSSNLSQSPPLSEYFFKFLLVGDAGVGKTSILQKYTNNEFSEEYQVTVGVEFGSKLIELDENTKIKLQIWDAAGQESFLTVVKSFYRSAQCIFLVYNVKHSMNKYPLRRETFQNLGRWLDQINENADPNVIRILIGNQVDGKREVEYQEGVEFMKEHGIHFFFETSAVDGTNIDMAFVEAAKLAFLFTIKDQKEGKESIYSKKKSSMNLTRDRSSNQQTDGNSCAC